jgi:hypothetical protein
MRKALEYKFNNSDFLQQYLQEIKFTDIRWEFIRKDGSSLVVSAYGGKTNIRGTRENGSRPVLALLDDIITDADARSPTETENIKTNINSSLEAALHPKRRKIIWNGTPFNAADPLYVTAESGDVEKVAEIIHECEKMKIEVLPPDVNASFGGFTVIENKPKDGKTGVIRFGFYTIKNMGTDIADAIIAERKAGGTFKNIGDFLDRIKHKNLNKKSMEALIKSGAMDAFGERGQLLGNLEDMLEYNKEVNKVSNQVSLFGDMPELLGVGYTLKPAEPAAQKDMLQWEKELLGLYVSGHPLNAFREKIEKKWVFLWVLVSKVL